MHGRFIRIGEQTIAIEHITRTWRFANGNVDVWILGQPGHLQLSASTGEAQAFWDWNTSSLNTTTLQIQAVPANREMAAIS